MAECRIWTVPNETYRVILRCSKVPLRTRFAETWNSCKRCCRCIFFTFLVVFALIWVLNFCHHEPGMKLESLSLRDMAVYQNTTSTASWQVHSAFNVTLSTWNRNTVAGCVTTFRRVMVRVEYKSQTILQQEVPLRFRSRI